MPINLIITLKIYFYFLYEIISIYNKFNHSPNFLFFLLKLVHQGGSLEINFGKGMYTITTEIQTFESTIYNLEKEQIQLANRQVIL